jgi:hypothetical protein
MAIMSTGTAGLNTGRIGTTDSGFPVYLYFDPESNEFRPVIVPPIGNPYYAPSNAVIRHDADRIPALTSAVVLGAVGAILGGGVGAAVGAVVGVGLSSLSGRHPQNRAA